MSIATRVAAGGLRPGVVLAEHIARHHETHAGLNALVQSRHAQALAEAERLESRIRRGEAVGSLAGVPVSVKECFAVTGLVTTLGIPARRRAVDLEDASIVARLHAADALVVGKGNVPQAMYLHETDNPVWGRTNHPLDPSRGPGGSSGGDAALVAAGVVPLAVGTDLAGSIRQPAHVCGICGFLPRSSTIGEGGAFDTVPHLTVVRPRAGFLAREVPDLDRALAALAPGAVVASRGWTAEDPAKPSRGRAADGGLRIAWWDDAGPIDPSPAVRRAVQEAVDRLARSGADMVRLDGSLAMEAAWLHVALLSADGGADIRGLFGGSRPIPPVARLLRLAGLPTWLRPLVAGLAQAAGSGIEATALRATGPRHGEALADLIDRRAAFAKRFADEMAPYDAVVCPVSALPALPHGSASRLLLAAAPCLMANLLDLPAGTVPITRVEPGEETGRGPSRDRVVRAAIDADRGSRGLPVGVQVVGMPGLAVSSEDPLGPERLVIDVLRMIEQAPASPATVG